MYRYPAFSFRREGDKSYAYDLLTIDLEYNKEGDCNSCKASPNSSKAVVQKKDQSLCFSKDGRMSSIQSDSESQRVFKIVGKVSMLILNHILKLS